MILSTLRKHGVKASFFLTGKFASSFTSIVKKIKTGGHYVGAHSDEHLLYCDWTKRDSLLVTKEQFTTDLLRNYSRLNISKKDAPYFLPPYEWYNDSIAAWTKELGLQLINYTPGTLSHADYTTPAMKNYRSSETILSSVYKYEAEHSAGLNGFILLMHIGAGPQRTDKLYNKLDELLAWLKRKEYKPVAITELLK